jgi:hypothetical protein
MDSPEAPQSSRALAAFVSCVSVVWSLIERLSDQFLGVKVSTSHFRSLFSHPQSLVFVFEGSLGTTVGSGTSRQSIILSSISKHAYLFISCSGGMRLMHCESKNLSASPPQALLPSPLALLRLHLLPNAATRLLFCLRTESECRIICHSLLPSVRSVHIFDMCRGCPPFSLLRQFPLELDSR